MEIGQPIRRHHVIPLEQPIQPTTEPRPAPPIHNPAPSKTPEFEPAK